MQLKGYSSLNPELIEWSDTSSPEGTWLGDSNIIEWYKDSPTTIVDQVGFVVFEDDENIILVDSFVESVGVYGNVTKIPKSVIRKRVKLSE